MASLADRLAAAPTKRKPGPACSIAHFITTLDDADAAAFAAAVELIRTERAAGAAVHTAAWLAGVIDSDLVRSYSLNRHINRDCRCES